MCAKCKEIYPLYLALPHNLVWWNLLNLIVCSKFSPNNITSQNIAVDTYVFGDVSIPVEP